MQKTARTALTVALVLAFAGGAAACGGTSSGATRETTAVGNQSGTVIIDVRTPEEFAAGHLEGAVNHDLNGGDFQAVLPGLDTSVTYKIYCRSGNRSGQAMALMQQAGFDHVENLGSMEDASDTLDTPIVTD